jgi:hypothetical protein
MGKSMGKENRFRENGQRSNEKPQERCHGEIRPQSEERSEAGDSQDKTREAEKREGG